MYTSNFQIGIQGTSYIEFSKDYGGVQFKLEQTSPIEDEGSQIKLDPIDLSTYYQDVEGTLNFRIKGPTVSGIVYMIRQLEVICDNAVKFSDGMSTRATYFEYGFTAFCLLKETKLVWKSPPSDLERLKAVNLSIEYKRAGLVGVLQNYAGFATNVLIPSVASGIISTTKHTIEYPASPAITLYNQDKYVPSGYVLFAENPAFIRPFYGQTIYQSLFSPGPDFRTTVINESTNNASDTYVFRYQPVDTSTFTTSGYLDSNLLLGIDVPSNELDVYAVLKTTVSDVSWTVKVISEAKHGPNIETDPIIVPYTQYPKVYYLGRLSSPAYLGGSIYRLQITPTRASGYMYIDQVVLHDATKLTSRAIAIDEITDLNVTASGNFTVYIKNNYFPYVDIDYTFQQDPFIFAYHSQSLKNTPVTYKGNAFIYAGKYIDQVGDTNKSVIYMTMLMPGSTYGTVSGLANWNLADRANGRTRYTFSYLNFKDASKAFITTL